MARPPIPDDRDILASISSFRAQLFPALRGHETDLARFLSDWKCFDDALQHCVDDLQEGTLVMIDSFSSLVASVTEGLVEALSLNGRLLNEVSAVFDDDTATVISQEQVPSPIAPYRKLASEWLVSNVYNPYPSQETRKYIATRTRSSKKDVDNWFLDARKRIGWNEIRRKHFDNKRVKIVEAAKRFFLNTDPSQPLSKIVESEFAGMQVRAQELYSEKFEESPLAVQLGRSIIDIRSVTNERRKKTLFNKAARYYPTPQPSPGTASSSLALSTTPPLPELPITSKRRASPLSESEEELGRPFKRHRSLVEVGEALFTSSSTAPLSEVPTTSSGGIAIVSSGADEGNRRSSNSRRSLAIVPETSPLQPRSGIAFTSPEASLPSPVGSSFDPSELLPPQHYIDPNATSTSSSFSTTSTLKRKQLLSEMEESLPNPKRLRTSTMSSRDQVSATDAVVQHATAAEFQWDQLLDFSQLPPPVSDWSADMAGPVDVSLFDFSAWDDFENGKSSFSHGSSSMSSNLANCFAPPPIDQPGDNLLFSWDSYGSSALQSPGSGTGYFGLDGGPYDVQPLSNQLTTLQVPPSFGCLPTFPAPSRPNEQNIESPANDCTVTLPKVALEAKEAKLRALQAEVAALAAEISAAS